MACGCDILMILLVGQLGRVLVSFESPYIFC